MPFFKKRTAEPVAALKLEPEKTTLGRQIAEDVDRELQPLRELNLIRMVEEKKEQLKYLHPEADEYKYEILKRTVFYVEVIRELQRLLAETLRGNEPAIDIKQIKRETAAHIEEAIARHYDHFFKHYLSIDEGLQGLEEAYREHLLMYEWLKKLIPYYQQNQYRTTAALPKRWIVRRIEEECKRKTDELIHFNY
ncbi:hypothetical protein [Jeotgalibacillus malaysiensis]|uniref:hypothetical protein n=1 Tax=Jeotgalibacillus malaysiensis TaxID=1508404 RepID=UPI00384D6070